MGTAPARDDLDLDAPLVAAVDLHLGRLADHDEVRADALVFDKCVRGDAVAPLFHIAEIVGGPAVQQPQLVRQRQAVDHRGRRALFVAGAAGVQPALVDLADKGIPVPFVRVADADRVDMAVVDQHARAAADAADGVAHAVEPRLLKAELAHLFLDAFANGADLGVHRRDGANLAQKLDNCLRLFGHLGLNL